MGYKKLSRRIELERTEVKCICMKPQTTMHKIFATLYCKQCNAWIEPMCNKHDCSYCKGRPLRPMNDKGQEYER